MNPKGKKNDPSAETRKDGGTTILDQKALSSGDENVSRGSDNVCYEKGATILGTYRVESDAIESGGMGRVWRVHHTLWNVDLAMKQPRAKFFIGEDSKQNFIRECDTWIKLGLHPNIVSCYYVRLIDGIPTIFSEWMDGGDLAHAIRDGSLYQGLARNPARVRERILDIAIQFARGLHYAHEARAEDGMPKSIIHQDVKPGNVLLTKNGDVKVADFGLAHARAASSISKKDLMGGEAKHTPVQTMISHSGGYTPAYCSPEQIEAEPLSRRTDLYSWAVSVMELYVGDHPWANGVVAGLACRCFFDQAKVPLSAPMADLLARCLAAKSDDRPHDFGLVIAELRAIYRMETGNDYPREASQAASDTADSLNNRALSMLDIGKPQEAEALWIRALQSSPGHAASVFNQSIHLWRTGKILDREARLRIAIVDPNAAESIAEEGIIANKIFDFAALFTKYDSATLLSEVDGVLYCLVGNTSGDIACYEVPTQKRLWSKSFHSSSYNMNFCSGGGVLGLVNSPDPYCFYSFGGDGAVNRIGLLSGEILSRFHTDSVYHPPKYFSYKIVSLSVSFNGALVACLTNRGADEDAMLLLNAGTLDLVQSFRDPSGELKSLCFLPSGQWIASDGAQALSIWDQTASCIQTNSVDMEVSGLRVCSDGTILACNNAGVVTCLDSTGHVKSTLALAHGAFRGLQVGNSDFGIASFDEVIVFDTRAPGHARVISGGGIAISVSGAFASTTSGVFALSVKNNLDYILCGVETYQETDSQNKRFTSAIHAGYSALERRDLRQAQEQLYLARQIRPENIACIQLNDAIGRYGKRIGIQTIYQINAKMEHPYPVVSCQINHARDAVVTLCQEGLIRLYSRDGVLQSSWYVKDSSLKQAYFSADDQTIIIIGVDDSYWIDRRSNQVQSFESPYRYVTQNMRIGILPGKENGSLNVFERKQETILASIEDCGGIITKAIEQGDKLYLFTTDRVGALDTFLHSVLVINLKTGKTEENYHFSARAVDQVSMTFQVHQLYCMDAKGQTFGGKIYKNRPAVVSSHEVHVSGSIRYPTDRGLIAAFEKSNAAIMDATMSGDGDFLFVANAEGVVTVFDVFCKKQAFILPAHTKQINRVSLEESFLATCGCDGHLKLWSIVWEYSIPE